MRRCVQVGCENALRTYAGRCARLPADGQNPNAGMMPPSDSEDEDGDEGAKASTSKAAPRGQNPNAGLLPPADSSDEDEDSDSDKSDTPLPEYLTAPSTRKK